jgi:glyceraldehyde 3-phosphate dehydrogenase
MDGWLAYHAAFVACVTAALYRCGSDPARLAADRRTLTLMGDAVTEAFRALRDSGVTGLPRAGILRYSTAPIVSRDVIGDPASCVFDSPLTQASGTLVKVFGWYDNEWGYTARLADLAVLVGNQL